MQVKSRPTVQRTHPDVLELPAVPEDVVPPTEDWAPAPPPDAWVPVPPLLVALLPPAGALLLLLALVDPPELPEVAAPPEWRDVAELLELCDPPSDAFVPPPPVLLGLATPPV